jgi:hypothetical protein
MNRAALVSALSILASAFGAGAQDVAVSLSPGERVVEWVHGLRIDPGVGSEMRRFNTGDSGLGTRFTQVQAERFREAVARSAGESLGRIESEGCRPSVEVSFPEPGQWGTPELSSPEERFLRGVVRTEAVACFHTELTPRQALDLYTSPDFRMVAEPRISRAWTPGDTACVATKGVVLLLSRTEVCSQVSHLLEDDLAAEHSQAIRNGEDHRLQPVFFKESLKTFVRTPSGLALYYINYSRSADLGAASRWIAEGKIRESQERQIEAFRSRING